MRPTHSPQRADPEPDLEALLPDGWEGPPPRVPGAAAPHRTRRPFRVPRKLLALLAGIVAAALLFALYAAVAVNGVRALERQRRALAALDTARETATGQIALLSSDPADTPIVDAATTALRNEHAAQLRDMLKDCRGVFAVDPGVRSLRSKVCAAIIDDIAALDAGGDALTYTAVDRQLERQFKQWRLDPGKPVDVQPFRAAEPQRAALRRYSDTPIGVKLIGWSGGRLTVVDIDASTTTTLADDENVQAVAARTWAAFQREDGVYAYVPGEAPKAIPPEGWGGMLPSFDTDTIWFETPDRAWVELDRFGAARSPQWRTTPAAWPAAWPVGASSRYFVTERYTDELQAPILQVHATRTRKLERTLGRGHFIDVSADAVVWRDEVGRVQSHGRQFDPASSRAFHAVVDPSGTRLATIEPPQDGGVKVTIATADGAINREFEAPFRDAVFPTLAWSPDGKHLFVTFGHTVLVLDGELKGRQLRALLPSFQLLGAL